MAFSDSLQRNCIQLLVLFLIFSTMAFMIDSYEDAKEDALQRLKLYFEEIQKVEISSETPSYSNASNSSAGFEERYMGVFGNNFGRKDQYMARCESIEDCDAGFHMICKSNKCTCKPGELFFEWPKFGCFVKAHMFEKCEVSGQCMAMNPNTYCNPENGRCTCSPNYFFNGQECSLRYDTTNLKAQEVYKAAVVAAACFIVAVVGIFVACIVRRSFCRREQQLPPSDSNRNSDIFSISDEIAALRAVDKPPSYEEVLQIERTFYGIPPPEYSGPRNDISAPSALAVRSSILVDSMNQLLNPVYESTAVASSSQSSGTRNDLKQTATYSSNLDDGFINEPYLQTSDIVTTAEVQPVPSDMEHRPASFSGAPSHSMYSSQLSLTPPPPRLHHSRHRQVHGSSSLPSSPHLSSISFQIKNTVVDLHTSSRKELLQQDSVTTQPESSHLSQGSCSSLSETSDLSLPLELSTSNVPSECNHSVTVIAYDNLGFESDLYL